MTEKLLLEPGLVPWRPNADVEYMDAWQMDDLPIAGVITLRDGSKWIFAADGELRAGRQRWWYSRLTDTPPETFSDPELMNHWLDEHLLDAQEGIAYNYQIVDPTADPIENTVLPCWCEDNADKAPVSQIADGWAIKEWGERKGVYVFIRCQRHPNRLTSMAIKRSD